MKKVEKSIELGGRELKLSTGYLAGQADGAVMVSYGETVVLATVVASELRDDPGYFPLKVEYQERLYAGGRIKGSRWVKREGRPSDDEILTARLIDRSIRPLFPKGYKKDVQVIVTVLSVDLENTPDIVSGYAVSGALAASKIPWNGPVATMRAGLKDGSFVINPIQKDLEKSEVDLVVSVTKNSIVMIEAGAKEVPEDKILEGIEYAQKEGKKVIGLIEDFAKKVGVKKEGVEKVDKDKGIDKKVKELAKDKITKLLKDMSTTKAGYGDYDEVKKAVADNFEDEEKRKASQVFGELFESELRKMILSGKRPDGRLPEDIRDLSAEGGVLPRVHGSAIFNRGQTQVLSVTTLGSSSLEQFFETAEGEETKRYIHHYSMPPYSVGETGRVGFPSRREIGHGALAERALLPVIPSKDNFPYTIRVVSEVLSSNGSTSMASTCSSTLSLMDAGVPIKGVVAGIAMGLFIESSTKFVILTDIVGLEDGNGDMDFKVAGTNKGVTALQLDVKTLRLTLPILKKAISQAKDARFKILKVMEAAISKPRDSVSKYAPKIKVIKIPQDKIGDVIGPGGRTIRSIIAESGAQVDVEDDGAVSISATTDEGLNSAVSRVEALTKDPQKGEIYEGEVKRVLQFGAFVEILPGREGLVHVSDMSQDFVKDPQEVVKVGDKLKVRVKEIDDMGRLNLSMLLSGDKEKPRYDSKRGGPSGGFRRGRFSPRQSGKRFGDQRSRRTKGPHFPKSRLLEQYKSGRS
ncbi:MAG: polyribonucleotide nucleotidyltransferase [Patescibacteria group bacterium]